jgi:hypothetical protein
MKLFSAYRKVDVHIRIYAIASIGSRLRAGAGSREFVCEFSGSANRAAPDVRVLRRPWNPWIATASEAAAPMAATTTASVAACVSANGGERQGANHEKSGKCSFDLWLRESLTLL